MCIERKRLRAEVLFDSELSLGREAVPCMESSAPPRDTCVGAMSQENVEESHSAAPRADGSRLRTPRTTFGPQLEDLGAPGKVLRRRAGHLVVEHVRAGDDRRHRSARL